MTPDRTLLRWGLILIGSGAVTVLASLWWLGTSALLERTLILGAVLLYGIGGLLAVSGVILLLIASRTGTTGPGRRGSRRKPLWSLRPMVLVITLASAAIAIASGVTTAIMEEIDFMHPLAQTGWLAFLAGPLAACGLIFVISDAVLEAPTPPRGQQPTDSQGQHHRPVGTMGTGLRAYALYLLLAAVGALALSIYLLDPWSIGMSILLLASTAVFAWGVRPTQKPAGPSAPWSGMRDDLARTAARWAPDPSPRQMSLILTGAGGGIAAPMFVLAMYSVQVQDAGIPYGLLFFLGPSLLMTYAGLIIFLDDSWPSRSPHH